MTTDGPYSPQVNASGGWTKGDRANFIMPYEIYKYDCPPVEGCTRSRL